MDELRSNADAVVEGSLQWAFMRREDIPELAALREAIDYFEDPIEHRDQETIARDYDRDVNLDGFLATVGRDSGGSVVAYGWIHPSVAPELAGHLWLETGTHPAARHRGVGRRLIAWCVSRAEEWHAAQGPGVPPLWLGYLVDEKFEGLRAALAEQGFTPQRWYFDAHLRFADQPETPAVPSIPGVRLVNYSADLSEPVRLAHNTVFGVLPGARPYTQADWEWSLGETGERPDLSWVALSAADGSVVGYALNTLYGPDGEDGGSEGWTTRFGVRHPWRHRGIGMALIAASVQSFRQAGLDGAGLGIDTEDPVSATRLLERCGFASQERVVLYARGANR